MKNMWIEIAKEYGVEIGEEFKLSSVDKYSGTLCQYNYKLTRDGLWYKSKCDNNWCSSNFSTRFVKGDFEVIKIPFIPKPFEKYYTVGYNREVYEEYINSEYYALDLHRIEHGNCYRTEEEALNNIDKHMKQFEEIKQKVGIK